MKTKIESYCDGDSPAEGGPDVSDCLNAKKSTHKLTKLQIAAPDLLQALEEIIKGEGPFSQDHMQHAINTIEAMKDLARAAIAKGE